MFTDADRQVIISLLADGKERFQITDIPSANKIGTEDVIYGVKIRFYEPKEERQFQTFLDTVLREQGYYIAETRYVAPIVHIACSIDEFPEDALAHHC